MGAPAGRKAGRTQLGAALAEKSDGYKVSAAGLTGMSKELRECVDEATAVTREFSGRVNAAALGDAQAVWTSFKDTWASKASGTLKVIDELQQTLTDTASTYRNAEKQNHSTVQNVSRGSAG